MLLGASLVGVGCGGRGIQCDVLPRSQLTLTITRDGAQTTRDLSGTWKGTYGPSGRKFIDRTGTMSASQAAGGERWSIQVMLDGKRFEPTPAFVIDINDVGTIEGMVKGPDEFGGRGDRRRSLVSGTSGQRRVGTRVASPSLLCLNPL